MTPSQLHELPENPNVRIQALKALHELDNLRDSKNISHHINRCGVKGFRSDCMDCALGNYMLAVVPAVRCVWVSPYWMALYSHPRPQALWRIPISLREWPNVRRFIRNFDYGSYPELVDIPQEPAYTG